MRRQFVSFYLGKALFGVDVLLVREIGRDIDITPVTPAPDFVLGLMNLRGQTVAVTDLGLRLGMAYRPATSQTRCVVLKTRSEVELLGATNLAAEELPPDTVGFVVDRVGDLVTVEDDEIQPPPPNTEIVDTQYIEGVVRLSRDLMAVLRVGQVLRIPVG